MDRTLVIVTCLNDSWHFELLCNTMQQFLEPCQVLIISNEDDYFSRVWKNWFDINIAKKLSKFNIQVKQRSDFLLSEYLEYKTPGWYTQQILKLSAFKYVTTDRYVLLDSKNFLTQQIQLQEIEQRKPKFISDNNKFYNFILASYAHFNIDPPEYVYLIENSTPFIICKDTAASLINRFGGSDETFNVMMNLVTKEQQMGVSEFYFYGIYEQFLGIKNDTACVDNNVILINSTNINHPYTYLDSKIFGINRFVFDNKSERDVFTLLEKLNCINCIPTQSSPYKIK